MITFSTQPFPYEGLKICTAVRRSWRSTKQKEALRTLPFDQEGNWRKTMECLSGVTRASKYPRGIFRGSEGRVCGASLPWTVTTPSKTTTMAVSRRSTTQRTKVRSFLRRLTCLRRLQLSLTQPLNQILTFSPIKRQLQGQRCTATPRWIWERSFFMLPWRR